jgi:hypothetical protein
LTVPDAGLDTGISIFIASTMAMSSPALTTAPTATAAR